MKKAFKLNNLGCANCAAKMEAKISDIPGVNNVSINFITTKLTIETDADETGMEKILESVKSIIKKIEPDVVITKA